ncbi:MAG: DUF362 domain-containing protein [Candidatus Bathyarchaeota archaeon]|nr:DUF362 domain-containing protein [Candidatus Bathyarchaeota archaeon]
MAPKAVKISRAADDVGDIIKEAISKAGLRGKKCIYIKPNLSHPEYLPGVVTSPDVIRQVVSQLRDGNSEVVVGESNGINYPCWSAFEGTGAKAAVESAGGTAVNLSEDKVVEVKFPTSGPLKRLYLPKVVVDADAIVDLPLMKTHEFMTYTGALKNLFGCIPSNRRIYLHPYLPEVFYRLYTVLKPDLTIMDARIGIEGNGPTKGKPKKMGLFLTGNDALAVDIVAAQVMRLDWKKTYLKYVADRAGFDGDAVQVEGLPVESVAKRFELPNIDLPVKMQMMIYQHEYATKLMFCSLDIIHLFQRITKAYRKEPIQLV